MIQIQLIREKAEWVKERLAVKNFKETELVDEIVDLDLQRRKNLIITEENKAKQKKKMVINSDAQCTEQLALVKSECDVK